MHELLHRILYTGIGLAALTEKKAKEIADDLVRKGEVSSDEGKKLAQELLDKAKHHGEEFRKAVNEEVSKVIAHTHLVSRDEYEKLLARVEQLEQANESVAAE